MGEGYVAVVFDAVDYALGDALASEKEEAGGRFYGKSPKEELLHGVFLNMGVVALLQVEEAVGAEVPLLANEWLAASTASGGKDELDEVAEEGHYR